MKLCMGMRHHKNRIEYMHVNIGHKSFTLDIIIIKQMIFKNIINIFVAKVRIVWRFFSSSRFREKLKHSRNVLLCY